MNNIFLKIEELAALKDSRKFNTFMIKHLDIKSEQDSREFIAHFEIWRIRKTQAANVDKMRNWEKAYSRGTEKQKDI